LGVVPDVYMVEESARRGAFAGADGLRLRQRSVESMDQLGGLPFRLRRYELLIVNSMEPDTLLERIAHLDAPLIGVVHNTALLIDDARYRAFFAAPNHPALVLGEHISTHFVDALGWLPWIYHVVFGRRWAAAGAAPDAAARAEGRTTFAVSGNVEFHRRNYASLLDAASQLAAEDAPFMVRIIGRSTRRDGKVLRADVQARGLEHNFQFSPGVIDHPAFFDLVKRSDFSLPLIDTTREAFRPYIETKLASSVPFAIGLGVPVVAHEALTRAYGLDGAGPRYADGGLLDAMRQAIASTDAERSNWRAAVARRREAILDASLTNLRDAIAAVRDPATAAAS
jgi:hypothetical protein